MSLRLLVSFDQFLDAYGLRDREAFDKFLLKINSEFEKAVHPTVSVLSFEPLSTSTDSYGNIHVVWLGKVTGWARRAEFGGEFVWLSRLASFRGRLWSRLENLSDIQLSILARNEFRKGNLKGAKTYMETIQRFEELPRSVTLLKSKIEADIGSDSK